MNSFMYKFYCVVIRSFVTYANLYFKGILITRVIFFLNVKDVRV